MGSETGVESQENAERPVSRVLYPAWGGTVTIYLAPHRGYRCSRGSGEPWAVLPLGSSSQPGDGPDAHGPPIWPCSRWGLAAGVSPHAAGRSYRPISPLP